MPEQNTQSLPNEFEPEQIKVYAHLMKAERKQNEKCLKTERGAEHNNVDAEHMPEQNTVFAERIMYIYIYVFMYMYVCMYMAASGNWVSRPFKKARLRGGYVRMFACADSYSSSSSS